MVGQQKVGGLQSVLALLADAVDGVYDMLKRRTSSMYKGGSSHNLTRRSSEEHSAHYQSAMARARAAVGRKKPGGKNVELNRNASSGDGLNAV